MKLTGLALLTMLGMSTCGDEQPEVVHHQDPTEALIEANRERVRQERRAIDAYVADKNWPIDSTGTGLRYWVYETTQGRPAVKDMVATIDYQVTMLNDSLVYSSSGKEPIDFRIGQDHVESGLHEGILFMKEGERAHFILPSHLAHGLTGDFGKVSGNTPLVYDIHLVALR